MRAYYRNRETALLEFATVVKIDNEYLIFNGVPVYPTGEMVDLMGWPDSKAEIYKTDLGDEFLIPVEP